MSEKALLVIDMPENCRECPLMSLGDDCRLTGRYVMYFSNWRSKPDWCPLNPVPEKHLVVLDSLDSFGTGWNACIDKILEGAL